MRETIIRQHTKRIRIEFDSTLHSVQQKDSSPHSIQGKLYKLLSI